MQKKLLFEYKRKLAHVLFGVFLLFLLIHVPESAIRVVLLTLIVVGLMLSMVIKAFHIPFLERLMVHLERKKDREVFPGKGMIMMTAGVLIPLFFVNTLLVIVGLLVVIIADTLGHIIGMHKGSICVPWDRSKHIEGRIVGIIVTTIVVCLWWETIFITVHYFHILLGVTAGMIVESLPLRKIGIDDNLVIPLIVALVIYALTPWIAG